MRLLIKEVKKLAGNKISILFLLSVAIFSVIMPLRFVIQYKNNNMKLQGMTVSQLAAEYGKYADLPVTEDNANKLWNRYRTAAKIPYGAIYDYLGSNFGSVLSAIGYRQTGLEQFATYNSMIEQPYEVICMDTIQA